MRAEKLNDLALASFFHSRITLEKKEFFEFYTRV